MVRLIIFLLLFSTIFGCERKANVVFDNRTSYNLYYTINDMPYCVAGKHSQKHSFKLGKQYSFYTPDKTLEITAVGETFLTPNSENGNKRYIILDKEYYNKDYNLIFYPNRAGFKFINDSNDVIETIQCRKIDINGSTLNVLKRSLNPGEIYWTHLEYNNEKTYYYRFEIFLENDTNIRVIADSLKLKRDEQLLYRFY